MRLPSRSRCLSARHDIAVARARYDERILAMTTRLNLMDKRWEELRASKDASL